LRKDSNNIFKLVYDTYLGYYTIYADDENVLDISGGSTKNGAIIIAFPFHGGCNQRWNITKNDDGTYSIATYCTDKNLELWGSDLEKGRINVWDKHTGNNQRWLINKEDVIIP
jgi:alpha-L-fucosidase